jgi:hypothetical protein
MMVYNFESVAVEELLHKVSISDIPLDELSAWIHICFVAAHEIVEDNHIITACNEGVSDMRPDKPGTTRY